MQPVIMYYIIWVIYLTLNLFLYNTSQNIVRRIYFQLNTMRAKLTFYFSHKVNKHGNIVILLIIDSNTNLQHYYTNCNTDVKCEGKTLHH